MSNENEVTYLEDPDRRSARLLGQAVRIVKMMLVKWEMDHSYLQLDDGKIYYATAFDTPVINKARNFLYLMEDMPDAEEYGYVRVGNLDRDANYSNSTLEGGKL